MSQWSLRVWNSVGGQPIYGEIPMADALAVMRKSITLLDECASIDALGEYVGRYRELGVDEFHLSWPRAKDGIGISREREAILERIAGEVIPRMRG